MNIITADYLYMIDGFTSGLSIAFDEKICAIDSREKLLKQYPDATIIESEPNSVIFPGFINTHVHLEFSANKTALKYGSFMPWLDSVIEHRDELMGQCNNEVMMEQCNVMLKSGITTFGTISSFGNELEVCKKTPHKVVFFNELIGSNAAYADMLYGDFMDRVSASMSCDKSSHIIPAIAIHSPYSVHPIILQKAINVAKKEKLPLSSHFLESASEREWLEDSKGELKDFFQKYFNTSTPATNIDEFMHAFDSYPTHFTHATKATQEELDYLASKGHSIAHCPRSNRYLGCGRLRIEALNMPFSIATDGLSSNDTLNMFDELRSALMLHNNIPIDILAKQLIDAITKDASDILGLNCGRLEIGRDADFAIIELKEKPKRESELALWSILHTKEVSKTYINGKSYTV